MKTVALIPARGGSKRIPKKNIREFAGVPALGRVIRLVKESEGFERVVVSTESAEIARVAHEYGAEVLERKPSLADDHVGLLDVVQGILGDLLEDGIEPDVVGCVLPTAVLMSPMDLAQGLDLVKRGEAVFVSTVGRFPYPIQRALRLNADSTLEMVWPENYQVRSQDLEISYHDAGQAYLGTFEEWSKRTTMFDHPIKGLEIEDWRVQDIDVEPDWIRAEMIWHLMNRTQG